MSDDGNSPADDISEQRAFCRRFEEDLKSGRTPDLKHWLSEQSITLDQSVLQQLLRLEIRHRVQADPDFDVAGFVSAFAFDFAEADTVSLSQSNATTAVDVPFQPVENQFGRFQVLHEIGRGGFGCVYKAKDPVLNRDVALKVPRATLDEDARNRFLREAEASAALDHPNIVAVYQAGEEDGVCYIAAAYCPGQTLAQWSGRKATDDPAACARLVKDIALGIEHAHQRGVVHRDLKPRNILLVETEVDGKAVLQPKVTDFGLAKFIQHHLEDTESSVLMGTPCYMAPEVLSDESVAHPERIDVYALGVVLFELLTGQRPYDGESVVRVLDGIRSGDFSRPRRLNPKIPRDLETICLKAMSRSPVDRYESAAALAEDLDRFLNSEVPLATRQSLRNRVMNWMVSPRRIYETGLFSIFLGVAVPMWIFAMILLIALEGLDPRITTEMIPQAVAVTSLLSFPTAWAGYRTLQGSKGWRRFGLVGSILNVMMTTPPLFGHVLVFPSMYNAYPVARIIAYTFLSIVFNIQVVQYSILLWSETRQSVRSATVR